MFQEKRDEEVLLALKTVLTHRFNDSKTIYKNTIEDTLQLSETILITRWTVEWLKLENTNGKENNSMSGLND